MPKSIILLCGLPGSGKSTLCQKLVQSLSCESKYILCVDDIEKSFQRGETWSADAWHASKKHAYAEAKRILSASVGSKENENLVILVDDNFYYKSMRRRYYQLCQEFECLFLILYLQVPLEVCLKRNESSDRIRRGNRVEVNVIMNMAKKLEIPGDAYFESGHVCKLSSDEDYVTLIPFLRSFVLDTTLRPPPRSDVGIEEEAKRDVDRKSTSFSMSHQVDLCLRGLVSAYVLSVKDSDRAIAAKVSNLIRIELMAQFSSSKFQSNKHVSEGEEVAVNQELFDLIESMFHTAIQIKSSHLFNSN
jgi:tRNA uridine 5-carbamoylmethylation protein Kti12